MRLYPHEVDADYLQTYGGELEDQFNRDWEKACTRVALLREDSRLIERLHPELAKFDQYLASLIELNTRIPITKKEDFRKAKPILHPILQKISDGPRKQEGPKKTRESIRGKIASVWRDTRASAVAKADATDAEEATNG